MVRPERRYFTVEEANLTLPLVRRVVRDLVHEYALWKEGVRRYEYLSGEGNSEEAPEQRATRDQVEDCAARINEYVEELTTVGCVVKGFEEGLVDFYGKRNGRDIFWCWKLGEQAITHWHDIEAGFAGRQPLTPEPVTKDET